MEFQINCIKIKVYFMVIQSKCYSIFLFSVNSCIISAIRLQYNIQLNVLLNNIISVSNLTHLNNKLLCLIKWFFFITNTWRFTIIEFGLTLIISRKKKHCYKNAALCSFCQENVLTGQKWAENVRLWTVTINLQPLEGFP